MAWYQRSYFNNFVLYRFFNLVILSLFTFIILDFNFFVNCIDLKISSKYLLKELTYNGITFKCSNLLSDKEAIMALENLLENKNKYNNFKFAKYYESLNGVLTPFNNYSCYSHPNLFIGSFENTLYNYQFSHNNYNYNFYKFTDNDIYNSKRIQFAPKYLYIYDNSLSPIYLNKNDLNLNNNFLELNSDLINKNIKHNVQVQNYINFQNSELKNVIDKSLRIN